MASYSLHTITPSLFQARCYNTKFSPPKKEQKDKNLSSGIKRFLAKKDEEDRAKERQNRENRERLEAMRDNKSKNKINKMLKVIKSANKSVVSDSEEAPEGPMQPDEDDYGYESQESSALYKRLMEKYKSPEDDIKNKSSSHTQMSRTTPIKRPPPVSVSVSKSGSSSTSRSSSKISQTNGSVRRPDNHKKTGTPVNDKNNGKPQLPTIPKIPKVRRPPPPVANFEALLKLAEQKQFEPIKTDQSDKSSRKDDRPMSAKEKREHEERMRMAEARKKRLDNDNYDYRKEDGSVDPKNRKSEGDSSSNVRPSTSAMNPVKRIGATSIRPVTATATSSGGNKIQQQSQQPTGSGGNSNKFGPAANKSQSPAAPPVKTRQFPPPDVERTRSFPPKDVARNSARPFPPADVRRKPPQPSAYTSREFSKSEFHMNDVLHGLLGLLSYINAPSRATARRRARKSVRRIRRLRRGGRGRVRLGDGRLHRRRTSGSGGRLELHQGDLRVRQKSVPGRGF